MIVKEKNLILNFQKGLKLDSKEYEALFLLNEECGEVVQAIGKILRHGPYETWDGVSNLEKLSMEIADVIGVIKILKGMNILAWPLIEEKMKHKFGPVGFSINRWLHNFKIDPEWMKEKL